MCIRDRCYSTDTSRTSRPRCAEQSQMAPVWRCTVDGCQTASLLRPQAAQLDLIAGHRVRSAAGTLLRSHESLNHLLRPASGADDFFELWITERAARSFISPRSLLRPRGRTSGWKTNAALGERPDLQQLSGAVVSIEDGSADVIPRRSGAPGVDLHKGSGSGTISRETRRHTRQPGRPAAR